MFKIIQRETRWLLAHPLWPVLMSTLSATLIAYLILQLRAHQTGIPRLWWLPFNIGLGSIPLASVFLMDRINRPWAIWLCGFLWLLFFPNAPYVLTDLIHLQPWLGPPAWLDMFAILASAWASLIAGYGTLRYFQARIRQRYSSLTAHSFVLVMLALSTVGIYIGRFLRFHSWHPFSEPLIIARRTFTSLTTDPSAASFHLALYALLLSLYYAHATPRLPQKPASSP